ncbi:MAG: hypothetical protein CM15mP129_09690 [Chloroflexota bacterium]|nr:MAG: hypothetical protein CM15mP129_09690 [Chloroflexota bacterium]
MNCPACNNKSTKVIESRESSIRLEEEENVFHVMKDLLHTRRYI